MSSNEEKNQEPKFDKMEDLYKKIKIIKYLGKGNQGIVYLGEYNETKELIAIKKIVCEKNKEDLSKIIEEVQLVSCLNHENIISVKEYFVIENEEEVSYEVYVVMEYCESNLENILNEHIVNKKVIETSVN
jgi:serine/threonine protein kinase